MTQSQFCQPLTQSQNQQLQHLPQIWVNTQTQLFDVFNEIEQTDIIALDTEFIKKNTYTPILALIQINTGKTVYLLDVLQLDLAKFWKKLAKVPTLVIHSCGEDLNLYYLLSNLPALTNVFDTQIGIGFLTGNTQSGYQTALADFLAVHISKEQCQSNWLQRPLSKEQQQYAIDDVRYLLPLFINIKQHLQQRGLWQFAMEDCQNYSQEIYDNFHQAARYAYGNLAHHQDNERQLRLLYAICEWRENLAKATNQPRNHILRNHIIREIIHTFPNSPKKLSVLGVKPNIIRQHGRVLLTLIQKIQQQPNPKTFTLPKPIQKSPNNLQIQIDTAMQQVSQDTKIPVSILLKRKWQDEIFTFMVQGQNHDSLSVWLLGWRKSYVTLVILKIFQQAKIGDPENHDC